MAKKAAELQIKYTAVCVNCGVFIPENKGMVRENKHYCETCAILTPASKPAASLLPPAGIIRIFSYLISLMPAVGFVFGAIFYSQAGVEAKTFGRKCFIMMFIGLSFLFLFFCLVMISGAVLGGAAGGLNLGEGYY